MEKIDKPRRTGSIPVQVEGVIIRFLVTSEVHVVLTQHLTAGPESRDK